MKIKVKGLNINYIQEGEGYDIILLHGWGCSIETMIPIFDILKDRARVTVLDLPGFGESDKLKKPINSYEYTEIVNEFIEKIGIKVANILGHSHGGRIGIILASKYPEKINKLVLIDSAGIIPKRSLKYHLKVKSFKLLKKIYLILNNNDKEKLSKFYKKYGSEDYRNADGIMRQTIVRVINDNLEPLLEKIKAPTLLVWGEKDDATPLYMAKTMENKIKDSGLVVIEKGSHYSYIDDLPKFKGAVKYFFKEELKEQL